MAGATLPAARWSVEPFAAPARAATRAVALAGIITALRAEARADPRPSPRSFARRAQRTARAILRVHGVEIVVSGDPPQGHALIVANHVSYLDPLVVSAVVPCVSIAKGESLGWPLVGPGLRALGVMFVKRGDAYSGARALRAARRALRAGASVLNFPEGTTFDGSQIGDFRRGCFGLARLAGARIVPLHLGYDDPRMPWYGGQTFVPHYWRMAGVPRVVVRVCFGTPLDVLAKDGATELATRCRDAVVALSPRSPPFARA
jgi:1-acyl-sn-glycerol-3-phosphate acyltransferase